MRTDLYRDISGGFLLFSMSLMVFLFIGNLLLGTRSGPQRILAPAPTPTPFQPVIQVSSSSAEFTRPDPLGNLPDTPLIPGTGAPPPAEEIPLSPHTLNILLTGSDTRPGFPGSRTDTIMILSLNIDSGSVSILSIPRDLYTYLPGFGMGRINTAEGKGGTALLAETLQYNLGITTHRSIRVNFEGFTDIIDTLGGIDLENRQPILDSCDMQLVEYPAGPIHLDGTEALCFARVRKSTSDFDRMERQQQIISAVAKKLVSLHGLASIPDLYRSYSEFVETDLDLESTLQLMPLASTLICTSDPIRFFSINQAHVHNYRVPETGAQVLLPDQAAIRCLLEEAFQVQW